MDSVILFDDIQTAYQDFLRNKHNPKLEKLSNWGRNRYFFSQYFKVIDDQYRHEKIILVFNQRTYCLAIRDAPDFMDHDNYIKWLQHYFSE